MTEQEWLACETLHDIHPANPLSWLRGAADRRMFLYLDAFLPAFMFDKFCPACRRNLSLFGQQAEAEPPVGYWLEQMLVERRHHSPDCVASAVFRAAVFYLRGTVCPAVFWDHLVRTHRDVESQLFRQHGADAGWEERNRSAKEAIWQKGMCLLREIDGNPFRPVALDPAWLTSTVVTLAEGIYQARAFDRMPILADALEDAGCDHADILTHCRQPGEHVRGCWVVDLLTGRK